MKKTLLAGTCVASLGASVVFGCTGGADVIGAGAFDAGREGSVVDGSSPPTGGDSGPAESGPLGNPIGQPIVGSYVALCTTKLALNDPRQALRFHVESSFAPYDMGGLLSLKMTPLQGWSGVDTFTPPTVSAQYFRMTVTSASDAPVDGDGGAFVAGFGTLNLEDTANSISGRAATIEKLTLAGVYSPMPAPTRFCARLGGNLTVPYEYTFYPNENVCLFEKVALGDPMPDIPVEEFVCPE